jgi:hypothetical protein
MTMTPISHALLVSPEEAETLLSGQSNVIFRSRRTELRMRVGILRDDGTLVATALLIDASRPGVESTASEWTLHEVEILLNPIEVGTGSGPLWRRLGTSVRDRVAGRSTTDDNGEGEAELERTTGFSGQEANDVASPVESVSLSSADERFDEINEELQHGSDESGQDVFVEGRVRETVAVEAIMEGPSPTVATSSEESDRHFDDARERALAFVPTGMIDVDEAHRLLTRLRDVEIKRSFPDVRPEHGILRRTMLQALLDTGVASREDYDELIPADLKRMTDRRQVEVYLDPLIKFLSRVA